VEKQHTVEGEQAKEQIRADLLAYGKVRYLAAIEYFKEHFSVMPTPHTAGAPLLQSLQMFRAARLCNPDHMRQLMNSGIVDTEFERAMLAFDSMKILATEGLEVIRVHQADLLRELPAYVAACDLIDYGNLDENNGSPFKQKLVLLTEFWKFPNSSYPSWRKLAHYLFLLQPSVACVDRSFSLLKLILQRPGMDGALVDLIEGTLMEMYNNTDEDDF